MKVLFICEHNSARSQMAEEYLNSMAEGKLTAESAGLEPGDINPFVAEVLNEDGLDIYGKKPQSVFELWKRGEKYNIVITVCSPEVSAKCPIFPGKVFRLNWPFEDPSGLTGDSAEITEKIRKIRDEIKSKIASFIQEYNEKGLQMFVTNEE